MALTRNGGRLLTVEMLTEELEGYSRSTVDYLVLQPTFPYFTVNGRKRRMYFEAAVWDWLYEHQSFNPRM